MIGHRDVRTADGSPRDATRSRDAVRRLAGHDGHSIPERRGDDRAVSREPVVPFGTSVFTVVTGNAALVKSHSGTSNRALVAYVRCGCVVSGVDEFLGECLAAIAVVHQETSVPVLAQQFQ